MRRLTRVLLAALFLSAAYLFAWPSATVSYFGAVVLHLIAGFFFLLILFFVFRTIWREGSLISRMGWLLLVFGGIAGAILAYTGTPRSERHLLYGHIAACAAAGALLLSDWVGKRWVPRAGNFAAAIRAAAFLAAAGLLTAGAWWVRTVPWQRTNRIDNPAIAPETMNDEGDGPSGPFFPSSAQTAGGVHIPASYFTESDSCKRCHADIYREWEGSAHHFSSFNNAWYRKSIEYMQDTVGIKPSKWCAGCHDPALLFSGMFDRPIREVEDTPAGQAGLGCMMCHSIAKVKSTMGQGDFELEYPALHRLAASKNPWARGLHDYLTDLNPEPHRRVFLKPFMRTQTAQFCSTCHKVHLDVPVNNYRWIRGFNEYDNWQASGVSGEGSRSFYYPKTSQTCADCHMPFTNSADAGNIAGVIHSHRFPAANTALPFVNGDTAQLDATEDFLAKNQVSVDIFAISPENASRAVNELGAIAPAPEFATTFAVGEEAETSAPANAPQQSVTPTSLLTAPMNRSSVAVRRGGTYRLDVVVRTRGVGHFFPGGTVDAFDCWLSLEATDDTGRVIFWSGYVEDGGKGSVDRGAHFYRSLLIDGHGNPINKRNAWAERAVVYVHLIPPGAADTVHYRVHIPLDAGGHIHFSARLNYRKFALWNTQFSFAGVHDPSQRNPEVSPSFDDTRWVFTGDASRVPGGANGIPALPIVTMAENSLTADVLPPSAKESAPQIALNRDDWSRWNDYGIGLLAQGDLTGAAFAFEKITEADPQNPDGWVNIGRVRLQEGNDAAAEQAIARALSSSPHLARAHYFYAKAFRNEGNYSDAMAHLREVLAQYPYDRVVHDDLGRILFLDRRYTEAIREFQATLSIDPEDLEANYNLMLCYTGLAQPVTAANFQKRYLRFKADEASQTLTGPYLRAHPYDNLERQLIHEHTSSFVESSHEKKYQGAVGLGGGAN
jgi:tetratricopeptide (TPR) repeat protein